MNITRESAHVKRVLSWKKGVKDDDNGDYPDDGNNMSLLDADEDDHDSSDMQVKQEKSKEQSRIR